VEILFAKISRKFFFQKNLAKFSLDSRNYVNYVNCNYAKCYAKCYATHAGDDDDDDFLRHDFL
jgi:hypothetical protein